MRNCYRYVAVVLATLLLTSVAAADSCQQVVEKLNQSLQPHVVEVHALAEVLGALDTRGVLPKRYISKQTAQQQYDWHDGPVLWHGGFSPLRGKMLGGYAYTNPHGLLPHDIRWLAADLDYLGRGERGAKRLIYAQGDRRRYLTVDHYRSFVAIPACVAGQTTSPPRSD